MIALFPGHKKRVRATKGHSMNELPYKSVAAALLFSVILGPVGLLYASFWGGITMIFFAIVVFSARLLFCALLVWIICCIWGVGAVESYNKKLKSGVA